MCGRGRNPAFPRAIPHGTVIIDLLHRVVFFGVSPGCLRAAPRVRSQGPCGDVSRGCLTAFFRTPERKFELDIEFDL